MAKDRGPYYITTAIVYASGKPHIGNVFEIIMADAIARFRRQQGYDVFFMTGTDEHGQKNETRAAEAGITPKEFVDRTAAEIQRNWDVMNTSYDKFIRTTDDYHEKEVQRIFKKLYDQGDIYKGSYDGMYCGECEAFYTKSQLTEDGRCPVCGGEVHHQEEEAYFFKMSKYADRLIEHINTHPEFIQPVSRKNEMMNNFLLPGLQDLCVSRSSVKWGIPVDFDEKQTVYVWLDALSNYITGIGYDTGGEYGELYKKFWPADLHLIGKDIVRFHTIYWPIFLMALDEPLPKQIFGHPWLLQGGEKMSKSKGNVLYADDLVDVFGVDAVRYFMLHEMPYENDGVITWELLIERINSDLANTLGNLVKRTVSMTNQYFGGTLSRNDASATREAVDEDLISVVTGAKDIVEKDMESLRVSDALTDIFTVFKRCNKYIDETEPWVLAKDEAKKDRLENVLLNLVESISIGASLLKAFMPDTCDAVLAELGTDIIDFDDLSTFGHFPDGVKVTSEPKTLFARLNEKEIMQKAAGIQEKQRKAAAAESGTDASSDEDAVDIEHKEPISIDDFDRMELRVGEIIHCEEVPKSKKLLCSQVKIGNETRQILSGIKQWYSPEDMVGKKVMVIVNLKPAKLAGMLSEGMILCAEDSEGNLCVMTPEKNLPSGSEIR